MKERDKAVYTVFYGANYMDTLYVEGEIDSISIVLEVCRAKCRNQYSFFYRDNTYDVYIYNYVMEDGYYVYQPE